MSGLVFLSLVVQARGSELILKHSEIVRQNFKPVEYLHSQNRQNSNSTPQYAPHSIPWPVAFEDSRHTIGNVMTQFQDYGSGAYYHGGDDLRVHEREWVFAPISGRLEAGHYAYETQPDGSNKKFWKPWPSSGNEMYFEVALIDAEGFRFELHHVDRSTLTEEVLNILKSGQGSIARGQKLGQVVQWRNSDTDDTLYHHTHYNIVAPDGARLNPEFYSPSLGDNLAPLISEIYATGDSTQAFGDGRINASNAREFIVVASDKLGENIYTHTPAFARLIFDSGEQTVWDFRERLSTSDGRFPAIWDFFKESLTLPNGDVLTTQGDYQSRIFLLRLKVPTLAKGKFRIEIGDSSGNLAMRSGELL